MQLDARALLHSDCLCLVLGALLSPGCKPFTVLLHGLWEVRSSPTVLPKAGRHYHPPPHTIFISPLTFCSLITSPGIMWASQLGIWSGTLIWGTFRFQRLTHWRPSFHMAFHTAFSVPSCSSRRPADPGHSIMPLWSLQFALTFGTY